MTWVNPRFIYTLLVQHSYMMFICCFEFAMPSSYVEYVVTCLTLLQLQCKLEQCIAWGHEHHACMTFTLEYLQIIWYVWLVINKRLAYLMAFTKCKKTRIMKKPILLVIWLKLNILPLLHRRNLHKYPLNIIKFWVNVSIFVWQFVILSMCGFITLLIVYIPHNHIGKCNKLMQY